VIAGKRPPVSDRYAVDFTTDGVDDPGGLEPEDRRLRQREDAPISASAGNGPIREVTA